MTKQILKINTDKYKHDDDMMYIINKLNKAAFDSKLRHDMNVEDEFFSAIENRDTAIMARDKKIKEQDNTISEQSNTISEQSNTISEQSNTISEQNKTMKKMIKGMIDNGMSIDGIAMLTGKSIDYIKEIIK